MTEIAIVLGGIGLLFLALRTKPSKTGKRNGWVHGSQSD